MLNAILRGTGKLILGILAGLFGGTRSKGGPRPALPPERLPNEFSCGLGLKDARQQPQYVLGRLWMHP